MICNICGDCIHSAVCDRKAVLGRIPYMTHCTYKHTETKIIVPELEKIKAKFEEDRDILLNQTVAIQIMDKHISELKGEN